MLHGHGSDAYKYKTKIVADFSSNVWYKGLPNGLIEHLQTKMYNLVHYPEPDAGKLAKKIADFHGISHSHILVTNGASEAFYLAAQINAGAKSNIIYPAFAEYEDACKVHKHSTEFVSNANIDFSSKISSNSMVWLGNPNNPDGKCINPEILKAWILLNDDALFIIDEAYGELCYGFESLIKYINELPNLIIVKSLTKAFAIPGLRLGYVVASPIIIKALQAAKTPWSVNALAIEAGLFIMENYKKLLPSVELMIKESVSFQQQLSIIPSLLVTKSSCNYFLLELMNGYTADLKAYLVENYGFLIRDASNFRGLSKQHFRVALQAPSANKNLALAITNWIDNGCK